MKKFVNKSVNTSLFQAKRLISKNPRLKGYIKRSLNRHIHLDTFQVQGLEAQLRYKNWVQHNYPDAIELLRQKNESKTLRYRPLISIITPTYNTDPKFLRECIESVRSQSYENWELCIVDDASPNHEVREIIKKYATEDMRIKYKFNTKNMHIAGATNEGIKIAKGEFISLLDHDDILWPNALYRVVEALNKDKKLDFLYSDEDKINEDRHDNQNPFLKPDWNPDFLYSVNYITHFSTIRKTLLDELKGLNGKYNGAQDWDLFLRVTGKTDRIHHIPTVLYSWRISDSSTAKDTSAKPYVVEAQKKAILEDLKRKGYRTAQVRSHERNKDYWEVVYPLRKQPLVSIVIPTKNQYQVVRRCVNSIIRKSTYKKYEIILVDTGSTDQKVHGWYAKLQKDHPNIKVISWPEQPFSYARSCNEGARHAKGEYLVMLNNDTEVITADWLELMLGDAQRKEIGAVGCKLFFPGGKYIQHAGIGIGFGGIAANSFSMITDDHIAPMQHLYLNTRHNVSAVTAACLMIRKEVYNEVGGFDEEFRVTYNDVDLCLRLLEKGYLNLYTPYVQLIHHESISVGMPNEKKKRDTAEFQNAKQLFVKRWKKYIDHDPHLNPNISRRTALFEVADTAELSTD